LDEHVQFIVFQPVALERRSQKCSRNGPSQSYPKSKQRRFPVAATPPSTEGPIRSASMQRR
jgi:hypothetical protein